MPGFSTSADPRVRAARLAGTAALIAGLAIPGLAAAQSANQKIQSDIFAARTGLPRAWVVSNKPGVVVAIRDRDAARAPGEKIRLQGEIVDDEAVERFGYRSMRSVVEVNCETRRDRVVEMEVFSAPNLQGTGQKRTVPGGWVQPSQDAYMADVIRTVCRGAPRLAEAAAAEPPPTKVAVAKVAPPKATVAAKPPVREPFVDLLQARVVSGAPEPAPEPRVPASTEAPITTAQRVPRLVETAAPPTQPPPPPSEPQPAADMASPVATPPPARPRPRPPAPPPAPVHRAVAAGLTVQVGALDSEIDARRALKAVSGDLAAGGFRPAVQPFMVGERTFYRALVSGFADRADAKAFCAQITHKGGACIIR